MLAPKCLTWISFHQWIDERYINTLDKEEKELFDSLDVFYLPGKGKKLVTGIIPQDCMCKI